MAADTYDRAADALPRSEAAQAGFAAAALRFRTLDDDIGALRSLDLARVDAPGSPLDERAASRATTSRDTRAAASSAG